MPVKDLDAALEGVRMLGYARLRVPDKGLLSLGVTIGDPPLAALAASGPWTAIDVSRIVEMLRETAARILTDMQQ